jgi:hypothetical protein
MAKFKPAGRRKAKATPRMAAVPCLILIVIAILTVLITLYYAFKAA